MALNCFRRALALSAAVLLRACYEARLRIARHRNSRPSRLTVARMAVLLLALVPGAVNVSAQRAAAEQPTGTTYYGATSQGGTVTVWLSDDGARVRALYVTFAGAPLGCAVVAGGFPIDGGRFAAAVTDSRGAALTVTGVLGEDGRVTGATSVEARGAGAMACAPQDVSWTARSSTTGAIVTGAIPAEGFGLVVFGGGNTTQLWLASGCAGSRAAFWVADQSGSFVVYIPGTAVAAVNRGWLERFPGGLLPANQPVIASCATPSPQL